LLASLPMFGCVLMIRPTRSSSSAIASGAFSRFLRHHASASSICRSASSLTRTSRLKLTPGDATAPALRQVAQSGPFHIGRSTREASLLSRDQPRRFHHPPETAPLQMLLLETLHPAIALSREQPCQKPLAWEDSTSAFRGSPDSGIRKVDTRGYRCPTTRSVESMAQTSLRVWPALLLVRRPRVCPGASLLAPCQRF